MADEMMQPEQMQSPMSLAQLDKVTPKRQTSPEPKQMRGDDAIAQADFASQGSPEEKRLAKLFMQSESIVRERVAQDPVYGEKLGGQIETLTKSGKMDAVPDLLIEEADKFKIEMLKKENPDWFNSGEAAKVGFFNEASFGQLSKIIGGLEALHPSGRPYADVVEEKAEQFRLLSKAFPGWTTAAQAAAYLVPGSPAKMLFSAGTKLAEKAILKGVTKSVLSKAAVNPGFLAKLAQSSMAGAITTGANAAVRGAAGTDLQELDLDRGVSTGIMGLGAGAIFGAAVPVAASAIQKGAEAVRPLAIGAAKAIDRGLGRAAGELSGTSEKALRAYNRGNEPIVAAAKKGAAKLGEELLDVVENASYSSAFKTNANKAITALDDVDATPLINQLTGIKKTNNPALDRAVTQLNDWGERLRQQASNGKVSAQQMAAWKTELQQAKSNWGGDLGGSLAENFFTKSVHQASRTARLLIEGSAVLAQKSSDPIKQAAGKAYIENMRHAAKEARVVSGIAKMLGRTPEARAKSAEGFVDRVFGKNRSVQLQRLQQLDDAMGTDFVAQARNYTYAKDLGGKGGPSGTPSLFNSSPTGRSLLGVGLGTAAGAANEALGQGDQAFDAQTGAAIGGILTSPRAAAAILGASGKASGFVNRMLANPEALSRLAKISQIRSNGATVARLSAPIEVQRVAQAIQQTLLNEGPKSAASLVRHVADTPYFVGLVHFYDLAEKSQKQGDQRRGIVNGRAYERPDIATPR